MRGPRAAIARDATGSTVHARGGKDVPGCEDCHGKHAIRKAQDPKARTFRLNIVEVCLKCHEDKVIEEKYGLPDQQVMAAYRESVAGAPGWARLPVGPQDPEDHRPPFEGMREEDPQTLLAVP